MDESELLERARGGDEAAFARLAAGHRRELKAHCYRMLGSLQDAEDALQETLLAAWRGLPGFEGRSSPRTWLYRIATNACLRLASKRPPRVLSPEYGPPRGDVHDLGEFVPGPVFLEPWPDDVPGDPGPDASFARREDVELAFVAALQHLPATQRAVLILREVLEFSAAEVASVLELTPAAVNSALQRARKAVRERVPPATQRAELSALGAEGQRELIDAFVAAWERADVDALVSLLAEDVRFTMPPLPAWFDGRDDVMRFIAERCFETPWRLAPIRVNGQPGFACYQRNPDGRFRLGAINVLSVRDGLITAISGFLDPALYPLFGLPKEFPS
ncbi:sigma-70 family RNA polymerase sigma factor [Actinomadura chibensis]|uniref:Sigma-70 family RNA polymerase sigma factor n=1 Tax=Actinomadura chibensis TaxID=392828 RepID=A0A5D0NB35_9ACTN|nr:sigma-70 family RNA polymerase sigma factor [Actinomadura chibensis]TYB41549.1 sigma-70 family RNA polymerase sigma factor [Actinomadura chibensis]